MPRRRDEYDDDMEDEDRNDAIEEDSNRSGGGSHRKRRRTDLIDEVMEEDEDDYDGGGGGNRRRGRKTSKRAASGADFFELEADVDTEDEEEEEEDGEDDFIINERVDLHNEEDSRRIHPPPLLSREDEQEDYEALERIMKERYRTKYAEFDDDDAPDMYHKSLLLPCVSDPKLWLVKCAIGHEREVAFCLMQKCFERGSKLQIRSAISVDHLENYIYIEADKEAHVKEACKGMRNIYTGSQIFQVPIKEMTDVLSVKNKAINILKDTWVRMKIGAYKGDLAKVVDVDNVRRRVTVKLIPRIDLQALANKLEGKKVPKKTTFTPPPRFMNVDEARAMHIHVEPRRNLTTGDYFDNINGMMFKDGFLYKTLSVKSISSENIQPTFDELEKFHHQNNDDQSMLPLFENRKKWHFMKGDKVIVIKGDLKNLKGWIEKVEEDIVHIKPNAIGLSKTLCVSEKEICKYFEAGNRVKVVSGAQKGVIGMIVKVEGPFVNLVSDTTNEVVSNEDTTFIRIATYFSKCST